MDNYNSGSIGSNPPSIFLSRAFPNLSPVMIVSPAAGMYALLGFNSHMAFMACHCGLCKSKNCP